MTTWNTVPSSIGIAQTGTVLQNLQVYTFNTLPSAGVIGRIVYVSDSRPGIYIDTGTTWILVSEYLDIKALGAVADNIADDGPIIQTAVNTLSTIGGGTILVPAGNYRIATGISNFGNNIKINMLGGSQLIKGFNGDLFTTGPNSNMKLENMFIDAQGATYTGDVVRLSQFSEHFEWTGGRVVNGADSIFMFESNGGLECNIHDASFTLDSSRVATGAVVKRATSVRDPQAAPRKFHDCYGLSFTWFCNADGFFGAYFNEIYSAGITLGDNCLGCTVNHCRLAVPAGMTAHISGNSTIMQSCEIGGDLTIDAGFLYGTFSDNVMDPTKTFTDNSIKTGAASQPIIQRPTDGAVLTGVKFPSSQVAINNPNTLDDYEEGTWIPAIGGTSTYISQSGTFTKIGRLVTVTCTMQINALGTGSANTISGLPFPVTGNNTVASLYWNGGALSPVCVVAVSITGTSTIQLQGITSASTNMSILNLIGNNTVIAFTVTYETTG